MHLYIAWRAQKLAPAGALLFLSVVLVPINILLPSDCRRADLAKLAILGTLVTGFFLFAGGTYVPGGAAQFFTYASAIVHGTTLPPWIAQRDVGYPLVIILSGYPFLHSLIPLMLIQAAFAIILPLLIYEGLWRLSPSVAFYTGLASILTLSPYLFMKMLHHDQTYNFFSLVTLCLILTFVQTKQIRFLYCFTLAAMAASVARPAGNALFLLFLVVSYIVARGNLRHYIVCCAVFSLFVAGYAWHRYVIFDMQSREVMPSYTGEQVFYDTYVNALDYGIRLSPQTIGPNFGAAVEQVHKKLTDPGFQDEMRINYSNGLPRQFADANIFPFTPDELITRILTKPNYEYSNLFSKAVDDPVLLRAAGEIARAHPGLILRYFTRNLYHFIFSPGYAHPRYSLDVLEPQTLWFYLGKGYVETKEAAQLSQRAAAEAKFDPLPQQAKFVGNALRAISLAWVIHYQETVRIVVALMCFALLAAAAALFEFLIKRPSSIGATELDQGLVFSLPRGFVATVVIAGCSFSYNAAVTSLFVDPEFRFRQMADLQAMLLAALGAIAVLHALKRASDWAWPGLLGRVSAEWPPSEWAKLPGTVAGIALMVITIRYVIVTMTSAGDMAVRSATYGANCGAQRGNVTEYVKDACDRTGTCRYDVDVGTLGDPAPGCGKDFSVEYTCGTNTPVRTLRLAGEASGKRLNLTCGLSDRPEISVITATYGLNCRNFTVSAMFEKWTNPGNVTDPVREACDGRVQCNYTVDTSKIGDPANSCGKDFSVEYLCTKDLGASAGSQARKTEFLPAEANGQMAQLSCLGQE